MKQHSFSSMLRLFLVVAILVFFAYEILTLVWVKQIGDVPLPAWVGNGQGVMDLLKKNEKPGSEFSFAVVGDVRSKFDRFERILDGMRDVPIAFTLLLGDIVRHADPSFRRLLNIELAEEIGYSKPMFYLVGNHDVEEGMYSVAEFEKDYGPSNFWFDYQGCLFVCLRLYEGNDPNDETLAYLESTLEQHRASYQKVFVFAHLPPALPGEIEQKVGQWQGSQKLMALLSQYNVNYYISSHYHGYRRYQVGCTSFLVTGGGGASMEEDAFDNNFYHGIVLTVRQDSVCEKIMAIKGFSGATEQAEMVTLANFHSWLLRNPPLVIGVNILLLLVLGLLIRSRFKKRHRNLVS